jgi:hypothetical protein
MPYAYPYIPGAVQVLNGLATELYKIDLYIYIYVTDLYMAQCNAAEEAAATAAAAERAAAAEAAFESARSAAEEAVEEAARLAGRLAASEGSSAALEAAKRAAEERLAAALAREERVRLGVLGVYCNRLTYICCDVLTPLSPFIRTRMLPHDWRKFRACTSINRIHLRDAALRIVSPVQVRS